MQISKGEDIEKLVSNVNPKYQDSIDASGLLDRQFSLLYLPSQGRYYKDGTSSLLLRYLSSKEESILTDEMLMDSGHGMFIVLKSLILTDFDIDDLLAGDYHAITMFLRANAYGTSIDLNVKCPSCGFEENKKLRLDSFDMKKVESLPDEDGLLSCVLPVSKIEVKMRIPTFRDEVNLRGKTNIERFQNLIAWSSEGENFYEILPQIPIMDMRYLMKFMDQNTPGVDTSFKHHCTSCHHEFESSFSIGEGFLKLPSEYHEVMMNEVFLCHYYGKGITKENAEKMPTFHRSWTLRKIQEEIDKKQKAEERAQKRAQSKSNIRRGRGGR